MNSMYVFFYIVQLFSSEMPMSLTFTEIEYRIHLRLHRWNGTK